MKLMLRLSLEIQQKSHTMLLFVYHFYSLRRSSHVPTDFKHQKPEMKCVQTHTTGKTNLCMYILEQLFCKCMCKFRTVSYLLKWIIANIEILHFCVSFADTQNQMVCFCNHHHHHHHCLGVCVRDHCALHE